MRAAWVDLAADRIAFVWDNGSSTTNVHHASQDYQHSITTTTEAALVRNARALEATVRVRACVQTALPSEVTSQLSFYCVSLHLTYNERVFEHFANFVSPFVIVKKPVSRFVFENV